MSYISKIIGKTYFANASLSEAPVAKPYKPLLEQYSAGLSLVLDGMRAANMTPEWAAKVRKEHGERVEARKDLNGKKTNEG
jgi:hypothetical protein